MKSLKMEKYGSRFIFLLVYIWPLSVLLVCVQRQTEEKKRKTEKTMHLYMGIRAS